MTVKSIAIIGAGPAGLAALYEFLHTNSDGTTNVGAGPSTDRQFTKVVAFEQKSRAGGIWASSLEKADYDVPPQEILDTEQYNDPNIIHPSQTPPADLAVGAGVARREDPVANELEWKRSGVFEALFTNVPYRFTKFSYQKDEPKFLDKSRKYYPFLIHVELEDNIAKLIDDEGLDEFIRYYSTIEDVLKKEDKWIVTVKQNNPVKGEDYWYKEEFDAVVISNGHYTVPYIPQIEGLAQYNRAFPNSLVHAKSYRSPTEFVGKSVLVLGGSVSSVNIIQHIFPFAKKITSSKRGPNPVLEWVNRILEDKDIHSKPGVEKIDPTSGVVLFKDGLEEKFDKIVLCTGYHYHYPFLRNLLNVANFSHASCVRGLYQHTFSIDDPTLGTVGVAVSPLTFHSIESASAALAGVWSGAKTLPPKEEQIKWEQDRYDNSLSTRSFHFYDYRDIKKDLIDHIAAYFPIGRQNPLEPNIKYIEDVTEGYENLVKLFYLLKNSPIH